MLIHSGAGLLIPIMCFISFWFTRDFFDYTLSMGQGYFWVHSWTQMCATIVAAAACYGVGVYFNRHRHRTLIDKKTGEEVRDGSQHTFFFVPMHWWAFVVLIIGTYFSFTR